MKYSFHYLHGKPPTQSRRDAAGQGKILEGQGNVWEFKFESRKIDILKKRLEKLRL